jgi:hypothetical protein
MAGGGVPAFGGASWEELELVRHESGRLLFEDKIRRRNELGKVEEKKVRVWVPVPDDEVEARTQARLWFASKKALDPDRDKALFDDMEQVCLLARAIRTFDAPHGQLMNYAELAAWDEGGLKDIQERINAYKALIDPREPVTTDDAFWRMLSEVAKRRSILPLLGIVGHEQPSCIIRMALEALRSPTAPSWLQSAETSTPEH